VFFSDINILELNEIIIINIFGGRYEKDYSFITFTRTVLSHDSWLQ
jgi:hypothetical protein